MIFAGTLFQFLTSGMGRWLASGAIVGVALLSWRYQDIAKHRAEGAEKATAQIREATRHAADKGARAVSRSRDDSVRSGKLDPTTRND
jgi:hypothetical protein